MNEPAMVKVSLDNLSTILSNAPLKFQLNKRAMEKSEPVSLQKSFVFVSDIDNEDGESIVVLEKASLDEIHRQSLASYEAICQKSLSMDCKSIISSLKPPELEQRLTEVLQENLRLKEALHQNNLTMKQHLNTLVRRQDELSKVYEAHKQKFAETKNLVNVLKTENTEYKTKIEEQNIEAAERSTQTENLEEANNYPPASIESNGQARNHKLREKCEQQSEEIAHMEKIIASLQQQLESLYQNSMNSLTPEDLYPSDPAEKSSSRQNFLESFSRYNEKLQALANCYIAQTSRYTSIQECLRRCSEILAEKHDPSESDESRQSLESSKRKELQEHRSKLIDEELKTICERQEMIKSQNEFQKIFTDYNSTLLEVESLRKERERMNTLQESVSLHDERLDEAKASLRESEKLLNDERRALEQSRLDLTRQNNEIEKERVRLQTQERKLVEANVSLHEETAVIRESNEVLREQLNVYESDWAEHVKHREEMRLEKNQLLEIIEKLKEEANQWRTTVEYLRANPED